MEIQVRLFATLRKYGPSNLPIGESFKLELEENASILDLLDRLGMEVEEAKIVMINGKGVSDYSQKLKNADTVSIFPPVGGGSIKRE
ncbi:MAG: MoaD/ThiS family protein [Candidatus Hodarchaeales archaeon]